MLCITSEQEMQVHRNKRRRQLQLKATALLPPLCTESADAVLAAVPRPK